MNLNCGGQYIFDSACGKCSNCEEEKLRLQENDLWDYGKECFSKEKLEANNITFETFIQKLINELNRE